MPGRLDGKVCVITGAASGIGAETAKLFASEGARVVGVDLDAEGAEGELKLQANVADEDDVRGVYEQTAKEMGRSTSSSTTPASTPPTTSRCSTPSSTPGSASRT